MEWSAAGFLLGLNPNAAVNLLSWQTVSFYEKPDYEDRIYSFNIGDPLNVYYIMPQPPIADPNCMPWHKKGVHARDFSKGKVYVNPSPMCTYEVSLDRRYKDLDGKYFQDKLTLPPNTAKILLNPRPKARTLPLSP